MCFLAEPSVAYKESYLAAIQELQDEGYTSRQLNNTVRYLADNFEAYVQRSLQQRDPAHVAPGRVPNADYWLIVQEEFIGRLNLRYTLNEELLNFGGHIGYEIRPSRRRQGYGITILRLGLEKAREANINPVLVTCDENNIGSKKIIEHNGGKLENAITVEGATVKKLRYWITV